MTRKPRHKMPRVPRAEMRTIWEPPPQTLYPRDYSQFPLNIENHAPHIRDAVDGTCHVAEMIKQVLSLSPGPNDPTWQAAYMLAGQHLLQGCQSQGFREVAAMMLWPGFVGRPGRPIEINLKLAAEHGEARRDKTYRDATLDIADAYGVNERTVTRRLARAKGQTKRPRST
jgi:hypothetical protein